MTYAVVMMLVATCAAIYDRHKTHASRGTAGVIYVRAQ